jgi:hypothetical protein
MLDEDCELTARRFKGEVPGLGQNRYAKIDELVTVSDGNFLRCGYDVNISI